MSKHKKISRSPLLYIAQPSIYDNEASMQVVASHKKTVKKNKEYEIYNDPINIVEESSSEDNGQRKAFKFMSIEEKLSYLSSLPNQMLTMKCEITTDEKKYRGIVIAYENDIVTLKSVQRSGRVEIPANEITDVRLKGF